MNALVNGDIVARLSNVSRDYKVGPTTVHALSGVSLEIPRGDFTVFLGPSGSGKTTLLNIVGGIEAPTSGKVEVDGERIDDLTPRGLTRYRRENIGFVFQFFNLISSLTALENVELAARLVLDPISPRDVLARVGLAERAHHFPAQLSGGEQQRVAIARAIVRRPTILLCDEPTGELDEGSGRRILGLLREMIRANDTTVLLVTHNSTIARMADRVVHMHGGRIASVETNADPVEADRLRW